MVNIGVACKIYVDGIVCGENRDSVYSAHVGSSFVWPCAPRLGEPHGTERTSGSPDVTYKHLHMNTSVDRLSQVSCAASLSYSAAFYRTPPASLHDFVGALFHRSGSLSSSFLLFKALISVSECRCGHSCLCLSRSSPG